MSCPKCGVEYAPHSTHLCAQTTSTIDRLVRPAADSEEDTLPKGEPAAGELGTPSPGAKLGAYRIIECIGSGGIGRVYRAQHETLGRQVAIKLIKPERARSGSVVQRFFGEARIVNSIRHENIVQITDFVQSDEGVYYIMELLEGESLADRLCEGTPPLDETIDIATQLAGALQAVHEAKVVHRDLKPENIFLTRQGTRNNFVKLLDFGVAKLSDLGEAGYYKTQAGHLVGTPAFMAPEQTYGSEVDGRADIYSLGLVMYEMLGGTNPFSNRVANEVLEAQRTVLPASLHTISDVPKEIPRALSDLVDRCLAKDPDERPQSMKALGDELRRIQKTRMGDRVDNPLPRRSLSRDPRVWIGLGIALLFAFGLGLLRAPREKEARPVTMAEGVVERAPAPAARGVDPPVPELVVPATVIPASDVEAVTTKEDAPAAEEAATASPQAPARASAAATRRPALRKKSVRPRRQGAPPANPAPKPPPPEKIDLDKRQNPFDE